MQRREVGSEKLGSYFAGLYLSSEISPAIALIRFLGIKCSFEVLSWADGAGGFAVEAGFGPGLDGSGFKGGVVGVFSIRPVMAPQIVPEVFNRIEFR